MPEVLPELRSTIPERLVREVQELEKLGHEYQVQASVLLRSGRPGWEAWFEAGLELKRAAQRLRVVGREPGRFGSAGGANEARYRRRVIPPYPNPKGS